MSEDAATGRAGSAAKVNHLVAAAAEEFAIRGQAAAKMANIADNANLSRRAVYKRYPNKEILYWEACHYIDNFHFDSLLDIDYVSLPPYEVMEIFFRTLLRCHQAYPSLTSIFAEQILNDSRDFSQDVQATEKVEKIRQRLSDLLSRGREMGDFSSDWDGNLLYFISAIMIEKAVVESSIARSVTARRSGEPSSELEERVIRALLRATRRQISATANKDWGECSGHIPKLDRAPNSVMNILNAAELVFGTVGFSRATISEIADTADVSSQLVYHYFNSKKQLYTSVLERAGRDGFSMHDGIDLQRDPMMVIEDFVGRLWGYYSSHPLNTRICMDFGLHKTSVLFTRGDNRRKKQDIYDGINFAIQRGIAQEQIHPEVDASLLITMAKAIFIPAAVLGNELDYFGVRPSAGKRVLSPRQQLQSFVLSAIAAQGQ